MGSAGEEALQDTPFFRPFYIGAPKGRGQRIHPIGHIQKGECRAAGDAAPDEAGQGVEHLKRILMEKCLLEKIKKKIRFRRPTERCESSWIMSS